MFVNTSPTVKNLAFMVFNIFHFFAQCIYLLNITDLPITTTISFFCHLWMAPSFLNILTCQGGKGCLCAFIGFYTSFS